MNRIRGSPKFITTQTTNGHTLHWLQWQVENQTTRFHVCMRIFSLMSERLLFTSKSRLLNTSNEFKYGM